MESKESPFGFECRIEAAFQENAEEFLSEHDRRKASTHKKRSVLRMCACIMARRERLSRFTLLGLLL
jgi:hypothetical protein